jgi:hypothetical protein
MEASMIHNRRLSTWRPAVARRWLLPTLLAGACFLALPVSTAVAGNASHDVENFTVSPDTMCGFTGTSHWVIHITSVPTGKGSTINAGKIVQTFVADNGRGLKISFDAGVFIAGPTVYNPDGSSSFRAVEDGLSAKTQSLNGPLLEQSTGRVFITYYFDANGDFVSLTIDSTTGPQNNTTGEPDCSVIGPYLGGA